MKWYDSKKIHCEDVFYIKGLSLLIESLFQDDLCDAGMTKADINSFPEIWIFTRDSADELYPFVRQVVSHRPVIVFGKDGHKRVLDRVPGLEQMTFLDISISIDEVRYRIQRVFFACYYGLPINSVSFINYPSLTSLEKDVLTGLMSGKSLSEFASHTGRSVKSISACKRRIMKKLNVYNNQELFAKACAMGIHFKP